MTNNTTNIVESIEMAVKTAEEAKALLAEAEQIRTAIDKAKKAGLPLSHPSIQEGRRRLNKIADHPSVIVFRRQEVEELRLAAERLQKAREQANRIKRLIAKKMNEVDGETTAIFTDLAGEDLPSGAVVLRKEAEYIEIITTLGKAERTFLRVKNRWRLSPKGEASVPWCLRAHLEKIGWILPNEWHDSTRGEPLGNLVTLPTSEKTAAAS